MGLFREETVAGVHVFMVREGRIINSNEFVLDRGKDVPDDDLLHMFLLRYYDATTSIPHEVILRDEPEDKAAMEAWLTEKLSWLACAWSQARWPASRRRPAAWRCSSLIATAARRLRTGPRPAARASAAGRRVRRGARRDVVARPRTSA